jgi:peptide/nickel transport system substrate-binding protein
MTIRSRAGLMALAALMLAGVSSRPANGDPRPGEAVVAWHVTLAPSWLDPSTAPPQITAFGMLYAIHDGLLRPLPGQRVGASLARTWTESADGRAYEFKLRAGLKFHNGDPVTADDVKFSFERYRGAGARALQERVEKVEVIDTVTVRFVLREPWPDFLAFYGTSASAAGIVVPRKYVTQVGDEGFRKRPIGAGPYRFVSHTPGVELVLEAFPEYWRHAPHVKRLTMKSVPEGTTRVAMVKNGEVDIAVALEAEDADAARQDSRLQLVATQHASIAWIEFADQWDPKSPWHDRRLRLAVNHALDRVAINQSACLGYCAPTGGIVPRVMEFALPVEPPAYDPARARLLLAQAGYPGRFDAGDFSPIPPFFQLSESAANALNAIGYGCACGRWSGRRSTPPGNRRRCAACSWPSRAPPAMPPAAWPSSCTPRAATPPAGIRTSTNSSASRRASAMSAGGRSCCTGSSSWPWIA